jgi:hypothetical protein
MIASRTAPAGIATVGGGTSAGALALTNQHNDAEADEGAGS